MMMSLASAIEKPMPTATPRVAQTTGFCTRAMARISLCMWRARRKEPFSPPMPISPDVGAGAEVAARAGQNDRADLGRVVDALAHIGERIAHRHSIAFFFSGRLMVTNAHGASVCSRSSRRLT